MKLLCHFSLLSLFLFSSCRNSHETEHIIVEIQSQAQLELENEIVFKLTSLARKSEESHEKYGVAHETLDKTYKRLVHLMDKKRILKTDFLQFQDHISQIFQNEFGHTSFQVSQINLDDFSNDNTALKRGALLLKACALTLQLSDFLYYDLVDCGYRFANLTSYPLGFTSGDYGFTLIGGEVQNFSNKNYQIDSILLNGQKTHLQNQVLPNTMANISITCEQEGDYEVFGHMNYTSYGRISSLPFQHTFNK